MSELSSHETQTPPQAAVKPKVRPFNLALSRPTQWRLYMIGLVANDLLMTIIAFQLAYYLRFESNFPLFRLEFTPAQPVYFNLILLMTPMWWGLCRMYGLYDRHYLLGGTEEYSRLFRTITTGVLLVIIAGFVEPTFIIARGWLLLFWGLAFFLVALGRFSLRRLVYAFRQRGYFLSPTLVIGANNEGLSLGRQLAAWKTSGLDVVGFVDKKLPIGTLLFDRVRILGHIEQLDDVIHFYGIEEVVLATSAFTSREKLLDIFKKYGTDSKVNIRMSSGLYEIITTGLTVKEFGYVPLVGVNKVRLTGIDQAIKFLLDYCISIPALFVASPVLLILAIAIRLDSPGPVIYRRRVMGVNGREFDAYKFRTMYVNGDQILDQHPDLKAELQKNHKLKEDPRITRIGHFLRKFSLDEIPQVLNVLKRDMSLVGPRMISPKEMEEYGQWGMNLLTIRPGITGLWQVSGRSDISYEERVRMDMNYIRNWSIWLDLQLILMTIPAVLKSKGAY